MFKVNNKTLERGQELRQCCRSGVFTVNLEHISQLFPSFFVDFEQVNVSLAVGFFLYFTHC